jgi:hypothetical protein
MDAKNLSVFALCLTLTMACFRPKEVSRRDMGLDGYDWLDFASKFFCV